MSKAIRPTLAAILGLAALTAEAEPQASGAPLRAVIEQRAEAAERARRYDDLDQLTTLWLTLERREQLDRVVDRADQFVNVSLRNQKRSEQRAITRAIHRTVDNVDIELPAVSFDPDQAIDAEAFVASLHEPYRSAVVWSLTGMNHREVADKMGASHAAVRKWAQRLRERLEEDGWDLTPANGERLG